MRRVIIVIPVYKSKLQEEEIISLRQTFRILKVYPFALVCPEGLDVTDYRKWAIEEGIDMHEEMFAPEFFNGIGGYNRMLMSACFYERFAEYEYMLVCQTDAYVFRDELRMWCDRGYDYIGAPLFGDFWKDDILDKTARVGNGGFSLRRIQAFLDYFKGERHVFKMNDIAKRISLRKKPYTRWLVWILMALGWRNKPCVVAKRWKYNEDIFWSEVLDGSNYAMCKPVVSEAMLFAFERFPSECYEITGQLPFGCHAWKKYQYETFWNRFIV